MSDIAIRVENLSKRYHIGQRERYKALRDVLPRLITAPFRFLRHHSQPAIRNRQSDLIWALKGVSFEVKRGEVVGIIGRNGAGKTTLLKVLSRITEPTEGYAEVHGRVGSLLEVGTGFHPELTGRENIYLNGAILGMKKAEIEHKFDEIVAFAEVEKFMDTPVKYYSSGMYVRLAFAVAAHLEPEILLVDEVLAVGDAAFQKKCLGKMGDVAKEGRTVLFVSHNMAAVRNLCSRALLLKEGQIRSSGIVEDVVQEYLTNIYGSEQTNHMLLAERRDRSGSGNVRVVAFQARAWGSEDGSPRTGAGAEFLVGYAARQELPISRLYVGIAVRDALGTGVFFCSTAMTNSDFHDIPPKGQVVCRIDSLPLIPGRYWVDIKLLDDEGQADYVASAASFTVVDSGDSGFTAYPSLKWGSVIVPHKWTLVSPAEEELYNGMRGQC